MLTTRPFRFSSRSLLLVPSLALATLLLPTLTGCSGSLPGNFGVAQPVTGALLAGKVYGGQQPVVGATIQLYGISTSSGTSSPLIASPPVSLAGGAFSISHMYSCTGISDVYLVATGGSSGYGTNNSLSMAAALGQCSSLTTSTNILVNELTTVAAAYALAPFATSYTSVSSTNATALDIAFQNASMLVNFSNGVAGASAGTGVTVPVAELNTLGNIIAACINTAGASSTQCQQLFSATGASETFGAALAMAKAPSAASTTSLYTLTSTTAPFQPSLALSAAPNDFSVAVTYTGTGSTLSTPYGIAIDASGNAWVTNETGTTVAEFSPTGSVLATPTATNLVGAQGIAVAANGSVWVANTAGNSLVDFTLTSGAVTATTSYTNNGIAAPGSLAFDASGNLFVANINGNSISAFSSTGSPLSFSPITNAALTSPHAIVCGGPNADPYVTTASGAVLHFSDTSGALLATLSDNTLQGPVAVSYDLTASHTFVTGFTTGTAVSGALSEFSSADVSTAGSPVAIGLSNPAGIATDGTSAWIVNNTTGGGLYQIAYGAAAPTGPSAGFGSLNGPVGVAIDASGSVWTTNSTGNTVSVFIGLAKPVATPIAVNQK
jgi:sugar lactone lactonase YvrE